MQQGQRDPTRPLPAGAGHKLGVGSRTGEGAQQDLHPAAGSLQPKALQLNPMLVWLRGPWGFPPHTSKVL